MDVLVSEIFIRVLKQMIILHYYMTGGSMAVGSGSVFTVDISTVPGCGRLFLIHDCIHRGALHRHLPSHEGTAHVHSEACDKDYCGIVGKLIFSSQCDFKKCYDIQAGLPF